MTINSAKMSSSARAMCAAINASLYDGNLPEEYTQEVMDGIAAGLTYDESITDIEALLASAQNTADMCDLEQPNDGMLTAFWIKYGPVRATPDTFSGAAFGQAQRKSRSGSNNKIGYDCPRCGSVAWGKPALHLLCSHNSDRASDAIFMIQRQPKEG